VGFALLFFALGRQSATGLAAKPRLPREGRERFAVMTFAATGEQVRSVRALIKSIREFGGAYRDCKVYVVLGDPEGAPGGILEGRDVHLLPLKMDRAFLEYPLALKAFAAAQVEELVKNDVGTLAWLDPGTLVLRSPEALDLAGSLDAALRPVFLLNTIGLPPGAEPNDYWAPIYTETGLDHRAPPAFRTVVDEAEIQPYFNCEVFSLDPGLGLCKEWARLLEGLLRDEDYQRASCATFLRRLFLHQAVLSGVIASRLSPESIKPLPMACGYPFNLHGRLAEAKRIASLNDVAVVIFDDAWARDPEWLKKLPAPEPLRTWLFETYQEYLEPAEASVPRS
jgi:hypothetical protein